MQIREAVSQAHARLKNLSDNPRLDAEVLLCFVLQKPRTYLHAWPETTLNEQQQSDYEQLVQRRHRGEPIAHLVGEREFWSLSFKITPDTLIPRPETELLVQQTLQHLPGDMELQLADLGTGSGAVAIAIASERPRCHITATDKSLAALEVATHNAAQHSLNTIEFKQGHWCEVLGDKKYHLVVSNPPYVSARDPHLQQGDVRFEPDSALIAGDDGLDDIRHIIACVREHLLPGGWLILEHGYDQGDMVREIFISAGYRDVKTFIDLAGQPRVTEGRHHE